MSWCSLDPTARSPQGPSPAPENEKVFLCALAVVHARGLAGLEDADVDAQLRELGLALEGRARAEFLVLEPARLLGVDDEPALSFRDAAELRLLERCLRNHASTSDLLVDMS